MNLSPESVIEDLASVARHLGDFNEEVVFVGGSAVFLLVPSTVVPFIRMTEDVDCVVEAGTTAAYYQVCDRLRSLGFRECTDEGAPICRWVVDDIRVDVMPNGEAALGFNNKWYDWVFVEPLEVRVGGFQIRVANIPTFFATKFDAFADRGHGDYAGDTDFEDIVTIMAYSEEDIVGLVLGSPSPIRTYLVDRVRELIALPRLNDYVSGCFASDRKSQSVVPRVLTTLNLIAAG